MSDIDHEAAMKQALSEAAGAAAGYPQDEYTNLARCYLAIVERDKRLAGEMRATADAEGQGDTDLRRWADQLEGK